MKLSTRLTVAMVALVLLTATAVGVLVSYNFEVRALPRALDRLDARAHLLALDLEASVRQARADVLTQGRGVEGLVLAHISGGTNPLDGTSEQAWRERLASRFMAELNANPSYLNFRLTGGADPSREIVSVDRAGPGGSIRIVPDQGLQSLSGRDYFKATIGLPAGGAYAAPISLSSQSGVVEIPHVPVLAVAAPVHTVDGHTFGIMSVSIDMRAGFAKIRAGGTDDEALYLVDEHGNYLVHPDQTQEFGWELGQPQRVQDQFPDFASLLPQDDTEPRVLADRTGARFGIGWESVRLAEGPRVTVIEAVPYSRILVAVTALPSILGALLVLLGAVPLAVLLARSLSQPLAQITKAVESFSRDEAVAVPKNAKGEIGVLARTFARMAGDVREKTQSLQHEIEERKRAEAEIRAYAAREQENEQMARAILDTALDAFVQIDESGTVIGWSPKSEEMFGWPSHEIVGKKLDQFIIAPEHREGYAGRIAQFLEAAQHGTTGRRYESISVTRDGTKLNTEVSLTALRREAGYIINAFVRDVTAKIAAEEQLRQALKMEAVGQLTGGIAHDFNNMLTVITGTIDMLADAVADRPEAAAITRMIGDAADRAAELTARLLAFARKQPLRPRETEVNELIVESEKLLRRSLGAQIEIELRLQKNAWPALIDPTQLTTALVNLAVNARDAMPNGGKLTLETKNIVLDQGYADANTEVRAGHYVMIAVSDTGSGIPEAIRSRIFEPFFTTKELGRGTGLGLSMVFGFVKQSGGHIKAYSEEGHGTIFKLYLPRASEHAEGAEDAADDGPMEGGTETILIVEDDALVLHSVTVQMASLGYHVLAAGNATEALAICDSGPSFDLLFTDLIMPGKINGRQLAEEMARRRPTLKVLFTSGYSESAIMHHGRLDPGILFLAKPYRKAELARALRAALEGGGFSPTSDGEADG